MPQPPKNNQLENDFRKFQDCYRRDEAERNEIKAALANLSLLVTSMVKNQIPSLGMQFTHVKLGANTEKMDDTNTDTDTDTDTDIDTAKIANAIIVATSTINTRVEILESQMKQINEDVHKTKMESTPSAIITRVKKIENQLNIMKKKSDDKMDINDNKIKVEVENLCGKLSDRVKEVEHSCSKLIIYTEDVLKDDIEKLKKEASSDSDSTTTKLSILRKSLNSEVKEIDTQMKIMKYDFETIKNDFSEFKRQTEGWLSNMNGITTYFFHKCNSMSLIFSNTYQKVYDRVEIVAANTEKLFATVNNDRRLLKQILKLSDQVTDLRMQVRFDEIDGNVNSSFLCYRTETCNELDDDFAKDIPRDSKVDNQLSNFCGSIEQVNRDHPSSHSEAIDSWILATSPGDRTSTRGLLDEAMEYSILLTNYDTRERMNTTAR
jgi:hypothetical protein